MEFTQPLEQFGRRYGNNRWVFKSWKLKRDVHFYSDLEYENGLFLEFDPTVVKYCEQPTELTDEHGHKTIPDVWVQYIDHSEAFEECKYAADVDESNPGKDERAIKQVRLQERWCQTHRYKHILRTEKEIRSNQLLLDNYIDMHSYLRNHLGPIEMEVRIVEKRIASASAAYSLFELYQALTDLSNNSITEAVVWLIALGRIMSNVDTVPFGPKTVVWKQ